MSTNISSTINQMQNDTNRVNYERGRDNLGKDTLDRGAFMQLFMAKLQNQSPLDPVKDEDFMSQQAQLAQLDKLDELTTVMKYSSILSQAGSLVGKTVDVIDADGNTVTGQVDSASFSNGETGISVNGQSYSLAQVMKIYGAPPANG